MKPLFSLAAALLVATAAFAEDKKKIDNPEFAAWSKFKTGTVVKSKMVTEVNGMKTEVSMTTTLGEVGADKLTVETATETTLSGMSFKAPAMKRDVPKTMEVDAKMAEAAKAEKPEGTYEEGTETLKIGGTEYKAKWQKFKTKASGMEIEGQIWTCDDVPSKLLKMVSKNKSFSSTLEVTEISKK